VSEPVELISFLQPYPREVQELVLEGREFLLDLLSPVSEFHYDATSAVCSAFGFSSGVRDIFINLAAYSKHVTLVFGYGAALDDPEGWLKGEGVQVRHIRLTKGMETLRDPYVLGLISQAAAHAKRAPEPFVPERIIKIYEGKKRRPS
jgi:hypothetical protein